MKAFLRLLFLAIFGVVGGFGAVWLYQNEQGENGRSENEAERRDPVAEALANRAPPERTEPQWSVADWPDYALDRDIPEDDEAGPGGAGLTILLADQQYDLTLDEPAHLLRYVVAAENSVGAQNAGTFNITFDPSYQHLVIYRADVIRDGERLDRRDRLAVDFVQQENLLQLNILTGLSTAIIRVADVSAGDTVDFAVGVMGQNPLFGERRAAAVSLINAQMAVEAPFRLTVPRDSAWEVLGDGVEVETQRRGDRTVLDIPADQVRPAVSDPYLPLWLHGRPMLQISTFAGWEDVRAWGAPMYVPEPDDEIRALADRFMSEHGTVDAQVGAAINFVQDEIRYFAVALGTGGYIPAATSETLRTRSGDCKAKVLLLLSILDAMGVEAEAAFVHTQFGRALRDFAPAPFAFNHVITRVRVDGRWRWIDPTVPYQASLFSNITQPDYGHALLLGGTEAGLTEISSDVHERSGMEVREQFSLSLEEGVPVRVRADMIAEGVTALQIRTGLEAGSVDQIDDFILNFYRGTYGEAELAGDRRTIDDRDANRVSLTWEIELTPLVSSQSAASGFYVEAYSVPSIVPNIDYSTRTTPVTLMHPVRSRHEIVLELPEGWTVTEDLDRDIENAAFRFDSRAQQDGDRFTYSVDMRSRGPSARPMDLLTASADLEAVDAVLRFEVHGPGIERGDGDAGAGSAAKE